MTTRRRFIVGLGAAAVASAVSHGRLAKALESPLASRISVLTDEISQDLGRAGEVAAHEFGLGWVELRGHAQEERHELERA